MAFRNPSPLSFLTDLVWTPSCEVSHGPATTKHQWSDELLDRAQSQGTQTWLPTGLSPNVEGYCQSITTTSSSRSSHLWARTSSIQLNHRISRSTLGEDSGSWGRAREASPLRESLLRHVGIYTCASPKKQSAHVPRCLVYRTAISSELHHSGRNFE